VVHASSGGAHGGGAGLSALGGQLVAAYRAMEQETEHAVARHFAALRSRMVTSASDDQRTRDA